MKLTTSTTLIGAHGVQQSASFRIQTSAQAFRLLSSGLYADKIGSVIREISCNAADAHIEIGTPDLQFDVKLPTRLDPRFYVRDYGPGLSHEDVMELYTSYFTSTKSNSNEFTGAFGLGSKSPFSYTTKFTVRTAQNFVARTYVCYTDDTGLPTVSLMDSSPSPDWEHGLEVLLAVANPDLQEFQDKAQSVLGVFRVVPKVFGADVAASLTEWLPGINRRNNGSAGGASVRIGNVVYPLNSTELTSDFSQTSLLDTALVLDMPIGDVDIAASREHLEYTPRTRENLRALLVARLEDVGNYIRGVIGARPDKSYASYRGIEAALQTATGLADHVLLSIGNEIGLDLQPYLSSRAVRYHPWQLIDSAQEFRVAQRSHSVRLRKFPIPSKDSASYVHTNFYNQAPAVIVNDTYTCNARVSKAYADQTWNCRNNSYLIVKLRNDVSVQDLTDGYADQVVAPTIILASSLEKPPAQPRVKGVKRQPLYAVEGCPIDGAYYDLKHLIRSPRATFPVATTFYINRIAKGWGRSEFLIGTNRMRSTRNLTTAIHAVSQKFGVPITHLLSLTDGAMNSCKIQEAGYLPLTAWIQNVKDTIAAKHASVAAGTRWLREPLKDIQHFGPSVVGALFRTMYAAPSAAGSYYVNRLEGTELGFHLRELANLDAAPDGFNNYDKNNDTTLTNLNQYLSWNEQLAFTGGNDYIVDLNDTLIDLQKTWAPELALLDWTQVYVSTSQRLVEVLDLLLPQRPALLAAVA